MDYWRREQIAASTGVVAVLCSLAAVLAGGAYPEPGATDDVVVAFLTTNRANILAQVFLASAGGAAALWFLGSLRGYLRRAEGGAGRVSSVAFGAGVLVVAGVLLSQIVLGSAVYRIADRPDAALAGGLYDLAGFALAITAFPIVILALATALVVVTTKALPRVVALLGAAVAILGLMGTLAPFSREGDFAIGGNGAFLVPFAALSAWIMILSVLMVPRLAKPADVTMMRRRATDVVAMSAAGNRRRDDAPDRRGGERGEGADG